MLYITGTGRSGSSILDWLLGTNRTIVGLGEVHRLSLEPRTRACSCGVAIDTCGFWSQIRGEVGRRTGGSVESWEDYEFHVRLDEFGPLQVRSLRTSAVLLNDACLRTAAGWTPVGRRYLSSVLQAAALYQAVASHQDAAAVVDSTKSPVRMRMFHALYPGDVKVIHLTRDGRGVVCSLVRRTGSSVAEAAKRWARSSRNVRLALRRIPERDRFRLRYEDLCNDVQTVQNALSNWLGAPEVSLTPASELHETQHQIPGSPILFDPQPALVEDQRWRGELTMSDLRTFEQVAGREQRTLGYGCGPSRHGRRRDRE